MITLDQYLAQMDGEDSYTAGGKRYTLASDLQTWAYSSNGAQWLVAMMQPVSQGRVREVLSVWGMGGGTTLEAIDTFASSIAVPTDGTLLSRLLRPKLVLDTSRWLWGTSSQWRTDFERQHTYVMDMQLISVDTKIPRIPRAQLRTIADWWQEVSRGFTYQFEGPGAGNLRKSAGGDCDDWAVVLRAELAWQGYPELAQVIRTQIHALSSIWLLDGTVQFIEPQGFVEQPPGYTGLVTGIYW